ncbi:hypothetical protein LTR36_006874 [Oleoguttula mirabilis]|uniref:Ribosome assembly protein 3 n=1 Tax=Oleoguttula mirabilis TaxID=1507867 RepID=A0AAV9JC99_9PEZI|nr:hypothetical protein LTR36_006874 [Oleoguttula mirabilis]
MAPANSSSKRKPRRKARTEVSSSSSSDSEGPSSKQSSPEAEKASAVAASSQEVKSGAAEPVVTQKAPIPERAFEDFYLRQATKEFANDLDKLRSASDFNAKSVPLLVGALKQGGAYFSREERVRIGSAASSES